MFFDGRGCTIDGANIELVSSSKVYNTRFVRCDIDDVNAPHDWAVNCIFESCRSRKEFEAINNIRKP